MNMDECHMSRWSIYVLVDVSLSSSPRMTKQFELTAVFSHIAYNTFTVILVISHCGRQRLSIDLCRVMAIF